MSWIDQIDLKIWIENGEWIPIPELKLDGRGVMARLQSRLVVPNRIQRLLVHLSTEFFFNSI